MSAFSPEERSQIDSNKVSCEYCSEKLSVFRGPQKCSSCGDVVCFKCCFEFGDVPHLLLLENARSTTNSGSVCRSCWAGVKRRLQCEARMPGLSEDIKSRIAFELQIGDKFLVELTSSEDFLDVVSVCVCFLSNIQRRHSQSAGRKNDCERGVQSELSLLQVCIRSMDSASRLQALQQTGEEKKETNLGVSSQFFQFSKRCALQNAVPSSFPHWTARNVAVVGHPPR